MSNMERRSFLATVLAVMAAPFVWMGDGEGWATIQEFRRVPRPPTPHEVARDESWRETFKVVQPSKDRRVWVEKNIYRPHRQET